MSAPATDLERMAKEGDRDRLELRAEPDWIGRIAVQARRLGISVSAYVRLAVTRQLETDEASQPASKKKNGK